MTNGFFVRIQKAKASFKLRASSSPTPVKTSIPALRSRSKPRPESTGLGSSIAATTRLNSRRDDGFRARAGASRVIARLQRDVHRRAACFFAGGFQRDDFRVIALFVLVKTFADDLAFANEDAADHGIGTGEANAFAGQFQRVFHEASGVSVHRLIEEV